MVAVGCSQKSRVKRKKKERRAEKMQSGKVQRGKSLGQKSPE